MNNEIIYLQVSLGEAIDKLTILDIKRNNITDDRKHDVTIEYNLLYEKLKNFIVKYRELYEIMKKTNLLIWYMMDDLRDGNIDDTTYLIKSKECIIYNDIRFRIKNKINYISNCFLKEQKSYKINRVIINNYTNENIINNLIFINVIKYLSFIYDEIIIISNLNHDNLKKNYNYDKTIIFNENKCECEYKLKVSIEDKEYTEQDIYELFNISLITNLLFFK